MPGLILPKRGLAYPGGAFRPGYDPSHIASAPSKGNSSGATSISVVASPGGNFINLLSGSKGTPTSVTHKIDGTIGRSGVFATSGNKVTFAGAATTCPAIYTFGAFVRCTNAGGFNQGILSTSNGTGGLTFCIDSNNKLAIFLNGGSPFEATSFPAFVTNVPYFVCASVNLSNTSNYLANFVQMRLDTGQIYAASFTNSQGGLGAFTASQPSAVFTIGCLSSSNWIGPISAAMAESTFLSLPQLQAWARDPWSYWYPQKFDLTQMLKAPSGGTAYTLAGAEGAFTISGQAATTAAARKIAGAEGSFSISGQAGSLSHGTKLAGAEGAFVISGPAATELRGIKLGGAEGAFVISGQSATLTLTTSGHYTLAGDEGAFTISGQVATLSAGRKLAGAEGAFTISGPAAGLLRGIKLPGVEGAFTISGQVVTELRGIKLAGVEGSFTISGQAGGLSHGLNMAGAAGAFTISGQSAKFPVALSMQGAEGAFVIGGLGAVLTYTPAGGPVGLPHSNQFIATVGPMTTLQ